MQSSLIQERDHGHERYGQRANLNAETGPGQREAGLTALQMIHYTPRKMYFSRKGHLLILGFAKFAEHSVHDRIAVEVAGTG